MKFKLKLAIIVLFSIINAITASTAFADCNVICSSFPVYDMARAIIGSHGHVSLLLKGTEIHDYEPSAGDIRKINDYDAFIYTGKYLEPWAKKISNSINKDVAVIDASHNITLIDNDPHIWLDGINSAFMVMNIFMGLIQLDREHSKSEEFSENMRAYLEKLSELDGEFMGLSRGKTLVFAGEFSLGYFMRRYGFEYISAYDGENEPSARRLAQVIKFIRDNKVKYIFSDYEVSAITRSISEQTGAEILIFNTGHNANEFDDMIDIMQANLSNLKKALDDDDD